MTPSGAIFYLERLGMRSDTRPVCVCSFSVSHPLSGTVLYQCALERDLELFEAGDMTEVGEKGLSLRSVLYSGAVPLS